MKYERAICWLRRDLRLHDHRALYEACAQSRSVLVLFIFDRQILDRLVDRDDRRLTFIHDSLSEVDTAMRGKGSRLIIRYGIAQDEIAELAQEFGAQAVFANHDYEPSAKVRDEAVRAKLSELKCEFKTFLDQVIFERRQLLNGSGQPYRVFTPYKRFWLDQLNADKIQEWKPNLKNLTPWVPKELSFAKKSTLDDFPLSALGFDRQTLWFRPGPAAARRSLTAFEKSIRDYKLKRNDPAKAGTSGLSVHLRFGTISIRECVRRALLHRNPGGQTWLSELIWRDFYQMILDQFPHVVDGAFKVQYRELDWPGTDEHFQRWCRGETGYPLVDAAMRHFVATGWMHNRLRMIVAMFLTKDLLVDWRKGEAFFARHLLDFDLAANNGGWQWCASTGVDAQPYFRIFNPVTQSKTYDPDGTFIKSVLPELSDETSRSVHWPHGSKKQKTASNYPAPIVEHAIQRDLAIEMFKRAK